MAASSIPRFAAHLWAIATAAPVRAALHPSIHPPLPLPAGTRHGGRTPETAETALRRLSHYLLAHYQKGTRPVRDWRTTTNVAIDLMVYAILSVVSPPLPPRMGWGQLPSAWAAPARPQQGEWYPVCSILLARSAHPSEFQYPLCRHCVLFFLQDEKNQVLTTYIWYRQVSR